MRNFSLASALIAVTGLASETAKDHKFAWTNGSLANGDKSVTAAGYTNWKLEGEGENQKMRQEFVQTLTFDDESDVLEAGEILQVYSIQPSFGGDIIMCDVWQFQLLLTTYNNVFQHWQNTDVAAGVPDIPADTYIIDWFDDVRNGFTMKVNQQVVQTSGTKELVTSLETIDIVADKEKTGVDANVMTGFLFRYETDAEAMEQAKQYASSEAKQGIVYKNKAGELKTKQFTYKLEWKSDKEADAGGSANLICAFSAILLSAAALAF